MIARCQYVPESCDRGYCQRTGKCAEKEAAAPFERNREEPMTTTQTDDLPALPETVGFRMRYRSEPGMVGHYPWTYADHRRRQADRPEHEREDLFNTAQLKAAILADRQARAAQADQCAEVAAALEIRAILEQIKEVAALHPADDMPTPFQSAWQLCCEEIFFRATGQQWHMDEDDGRRNVSGETAGQKIVRAAAPQPVAEAYQRGIVQGMNDVLHNGIDWARAQFSGAPLAATHPEQQSTAQPVALWQFRWLNMDNEPNPAPSLLEWTEVKPWNPNLQTLEQRIEELRAFRYKGKPAYEVRALYAAPPRTDAPALTDEQCDAVYEELHEWASDIDSYDFGLPQYAGGGKEAGREVIRRALRTASKPTGVQKHG